MLQTILLVLGLFVALVSMVILVEGTSLSELVSDIRTRNARTRRLRRCRRDNAVYPYFYDVGLKNRAEAQPPAPVGGRVGVSRCGLEGAPMPPGMSSLYTLHHRGTGHLVPCTGEEVRRWRQAAVEYVTTLREAGAALRAEHERARLRPVQLLPGGRRRIAAELREARGRFQSAALTAAAAYRPVHDEIANRLKSEPARGIRRGWRPAPLTSRERHPL
ncbi:hypothetical protein ABZ470_01525 [Streptosporangium sp. NPDC020072]|uniref:hypothetical protein n=1 Tax=Streptosporangium sp. NPDC020072 TaxID=3154788 RepID=UPI003419381E